MTASSFPLFHRINKDTLSHTDSHLHSSHTYTHPTLILTLTHHPPLEYALSRTLLSQGGKREQGPRQAHTRPPPPPPAPPPPGPVCKCVCVYTTLCHTPSFRPCEAREPTHSKNTRTNQAQDGTHGRVSSQEILHLLPSPLLYARWLQLTLQGQQGRCTGEEPHDLDHRQSDY